MCKNAHKYDSFIIYNKYTLIHSYTNGGVQLKKTVLEYSTTSPLHVYIDEIDKGENKVVHQMMWQLQTAGIGWMLLLYFSPSLKKKKTWQRPPYKAKARMTDYNPVSAHGSATISQCTLTNIKELFFFFLVWLSVLFYFSEASGSRWLRGGRSHHWQPHSSTIMSSWCRRSISPFS